MTRGAVRKQTLPIWHILRLDKFCCVTISLESCDDDYDDDKVVVVVC